MTANHSAGVQAVVTLLPVDGEVAPALFPAAELTLMFLMNRLVEGAVAAEMAEPSAQKAAISPPDAEPDEVAVGGGACRSRNAGP